MAGIVDFDETVRCTFMQAFESLALSQTIFMILPPFGECPVLRLKRFCAAGTCNVRIKKIVVVVAGVEKEENAAFPLFLKRPAAFFPVEAGV